MPRFMTYSLLFAVQSALALGVAAKEAGPTIITLDASSAGTTARVAPLPQGTFPYQVNDRGEIGGNYQDANNVLHGFLRTRKGAYVGFDAP
jgi:hypothetical protein